MFRHTSLYKRLLLRERLLPLIDKYIAGEATEEEVALLHRYYESLQQNEDWPVNELGDMSDADKRLHAQIKQAIQEPAQQNHVPVRAIKIRRLYIWSAAASLAGLLVWAAILVLPGKKTPEVQVVAAAGIPHEKAVLTLANGQVIYLDKKRDTAIRNGDTRITAAAGAVQIDASALTTADTALNTLATPHGDVFSIRLPDGSLVWLNTTSSIRFPSRFSGKERRVYITGEAYFEVAQQKTQPFVVAANGADIKVLGTHFNVMAYNDEGELKTTLLEGAVKFEHNNMAVMLAPGQQSRLDKAGHVSVVEVPADKEISWIQGVFHFDNESLPAVLRQFERWYNVEVVMKRRITGDDMVTAEIPRRTSLQDALKALELAEMARFEIKGRKVIVY